jgi:mono/diheme cytochrome c family protein
MNKGMQKIKFSNKKTAAILAATLMVGMVSCSKNPLSPGIEFMPDMYRGPALETYGENSFFADSLSTRKPVEGTVSQGRIAYAPFGINTLAYPYPNTPEGYEMAGQELKNPLPANEQNIAEGKALYEKFCINCHGDAGKGDGSIVALGKYPSPGSYVSKVPAGLNDGKMYHTITYGKGLMGSHASQVTKEERWKLVLYVNELIKKANGGVAPTAATADSTKVTPSNDKK